MSLGGRVGLSIPAVNRPRKPRRRAVGLSRSDPAPFTRAPTCAELRHVGGSSGSASAYGPSSSQGDGLAGEADSRAPSSG